MTDSRANEVSALPSLGESQEWPMVIIPSFPSSKALEVMGRAVVLFAQFEYYLIVIYKRAVPGALLPNIIEKRGKDSLGALLNGVRNRGSEKDFKGLIKTATEGNESLLSIMPQLEKARGLAQVRKKYMHGGIARRKSDSELCFLNPGGGTTDVYIFNELDQACSDIESLISQIQEKIPTPKS
jgi:hypothetical protein